jgi:hypothetical protein
MVYVGGEFSVNVSSFLLAIDEVHEASIPDQSIISEQCGLKTESAFACVNVSKVNYIQDPSM